MFLKSNLLLSSTVRDNLFVFPTYLIYSQAWAHRAAWLGDQSGSLVVPCHVFPAHILRPIICACARRQVTVVCYILLLWLEAKVQTKTVNSLPFLVGTEQKWAGQSFFKIVNFAFSSLSIYKKSVIS